MKKINLLLIFLILLTQVSFTQDIDRQKFFVNYIKLPLKKLPDNIETYSVSIKTLDTDWGNTLGNIYDIEKIVLNGYHRLDEDADMSIIITPERGLVFDKIKQGLSILKYKASKNSPEVAYNAFYYTVYYYKPLITLKILSKTGGIIYEAKFGGSQETATFGNFEYETAYRAETALSHAWGEQKKGFLAGKEKPNYDGVISYIAVDIKDYCLIPFFTPEFSIRYVDEKKKNDYADLKEAKDLFMEGIKHISKDKVALINKLIQPEYEQRKEKITKAIQIWEKALSEADYKNTKARIDFKVARHINYNLALGYLWIDDFAKAKEYLFSRKEEVTRKFMLNNVLAGIEDLTAFINQQEKLDSLNRWRKRMLNDDAPYVYLKKEEKSMAATVTNKMTKGTTLQKNVKEASKSKTTSPVTKNNSSKTGMPLMQEEGQDKAALKEDNIIIRNVNYTQLQTISGYLKKQPRIKNLTKAMQEKQGKISMDHSMPLDQVADLLLKCNCGVKMEVLSVNDDQIEVEIK